MGYRLTLRVTQNCDREDRLHIFTGIAGGGAQVPEVIDISR